MTAHSPDESHAASTDGTGTVLRPATAADVEAIAALWQGGWGDAHHGHVPDALLQHRQLDDFRTLARSRVPLTTVAESASGVVGFVTVHDDELEQIYVSREARGTGLAVTLLRFAEREIAARAEVAWLAVVAGNARARRFYERGGWQDGGALDYAAEITGGTLIVPCRRYEKRVKG